MVSQTKSQGPALQANDMPKGKRADEMNGSSAPLTDSDYAAKQLAALETEVSSKLHIDTDEVSKDPLLTDAVQSASAVGNFDSDPLSATGYSSPLHSVNWDAIAARQNSLNAVLNGGTAAPEGSAWEALKRLGPKYPPSLEKLVMDYHHRHSKSWQLVHDMGAGSGVYSPTLAKYFRHVHVSDPSPTGTATSRSLMSAWAAQNKKSRGRFTFSTSPPETSHNCVADATVDMAIVTQGAHGTDAERLVRSAAQSLAPGGTLALVAYAPLPRVAGSAPADAAVQQLFEAWGDKARREVADALGPDAVPVPADLFEQSKTRRIRVNWPVDTPFAGGEGEVVDASASRVHTAERTHAYSSGAQDEGARGWRQEVGPEFFRALTAAVLGPAAANGREFEGLFAEIEKAVRETSVDGILIGVEWRAGVVLATKK